MTKLARLVNSSALLAALACGDGSASEQTGAVEVHISGQEFAKQGWPVTIDGETTAFDDGWTVRFDHVIASVASFRMAEGSDTVVADDPAGYLVDLQKDDFDVWTLDAVPARRWSDVGYRFAVPGASTTRVGNVPSEIADAMQAERYSLWLEGTGAKDGRSITFRFGIPGEVTSRNCLNGHDETFGMVVGEGRTTAVELTLHMDHLFWDDHDAEEPRLLFGPIAYAAGDDDVVTLDALQTQRLTDLRDETGAPLTDADGVPIAYVPREQLTDDNLREYIIDTALTLGHFNGEGHCEYEIRH